MPSIIGTYAIVTLASFIGLTILTSSPLFALFVCGWIGLFAAISINELTPGYTMR